MAYSAPKHRVFSQRMKAWFEALQNLRDEAVRLDEIYTNETASGSDAAFQATNVATKQEHIDGIVFLRAFKDFIENGAVSRADRVPNITPFTQQREA